MVLMSGKLGHAQGRQANHRLQGLFEPPVEVCLLSLSCSESKHPSSNITHTMWVVFVALYQERTFSIKSKMKHRGMLTPNGTCKLKYCSSSSLIALDTLFTRYTISLEALGAQMATSCPLCYSSQLPTTTEDSPAVTGGNLEEKNSEA